MQAIKSHPETQLSHTDFALVAALLVPLAIIGLLVLVGVGVGVAVCTMFVTVFAVTTALDVRWLLRRRRTTDDLRRAAA